MRTPHLLVLPAVLLAAVTVVACGASGPSLASSAAAPTPAASTPADPTPVIPTASPSTADGTYWMRLSTWQAIPPVNLFAVADTAVIDAAGMLVMQGPVDAIFPGPLVMPLVGRQVSEEGKAQIVAWAKELGLLGGPTDFTGGGGMPGGQTGRIELTVGGERVTLTGLLPAEGMPQDQPDPGSPEAFTELWRRLADLPGTLNTQLGPESSYTPFGYAVLIGPAPDPQGEALDAQVRVWPLATPVNEFGTAVQNGTARCGLVTGSDATVLGAAVSQANQLTQWTANEATSATFGLTVRPIVEGENPCAEVFGVE